jgi:SRSO17 transposase
MAIGRREATESRFTRYVEGLVSVIGHADRAGPLHDYCVGLMVPCERKSVEPIAARTAPAGTSAQHQKLLHFVGVAPWSDDKVLVKMREMVLPAIERQGQIEAWIIDDTSFPKQGRHSVGVARQYAANSARKTIARLRCHCRWRTGMPACRWLIVFTCRENGQTIANVSAKRVFRTTLASRPSMRSRSTRSVRRARPACRVVWY